MLSKTPAMGERYNAEKKYRLKESHVVTQEAVDLEFALFAPANLQPNITRSEMSRVSVDGECMT